MKEFNSQICTSREQSERLLALGLKKETADMGFRELGNGWREYFVNGDVYNLSPSKIFPAWSLHRMIEMADTTTYINEGREDEHELWFCMDKCYCWNNHESFYSTNLYDSLINCIEWLIKEGYFNKEYLER
jgi:hypothetical protein